jgi:hypothetical protein
MKPRGRESGYAMLAVFLMAALVAIMLYTEVPRVAFEAERQRELLLVDRGNQFKRAIQVFVTDKTNNPTHRYPASLDELESFNNHRYLRRRYVDPMTGKDEWRLVHINGGVLTDSVTTKPVTGTQSTSNTPAVSDYITQQAFLDSGSGANRGGGAARALGRRPSDSQQPGAPGDPSMPAGGSPGMQGNADGASPSGTPPSANGLPPGGMPGIPGIPGQPGLPGMPGQPGASSGGQPAQQPCTVYIGTCPTTPAVSGQQAGQPGVAGLPPQPGNPMNSQGFGGGSGAVPGTPGANTAAANMINNLLTQPRPGGMPTAMPGATIGGGIAGVASKYEAEGIMVINERTAINEWEYIFDQSKYRAPPNPVSGTVGTPQQPMGAGGGTSTPGASPAGPGMGGSGIGPGGGRGGVGQ